jgi:type I restriction enzyme S subunit
MSEELPNTWEEVRLSDVCDPVSQLGPEAKGSTFRYIDLGAIDNRAKRVAEAAVVPTAAAPSRAKQIVRAGDVVFSTVRVYLENIAEVPKELDGEIASTAFCVLRPKSGISSRYLYHYVTARRFVLAVNERQRGNSPPSVQDSDIRSQMIRLAPAKEQERIASRIDELFSRIDEGERALERVQKLVERHRQSVLKDAVTGELTREWRKENARNFESGKALLARILDARRTAWEKVELDKMQARARKPANDKWKEKYVVPAAPNTTNLPKLPEGWVWASLDQLSSKITSGSRDWKEYYGRGNSVFVMAQNVRRGRLDLSELQFVDPPPGNRDAERSAIQRDDLLVTIVGANTGDVCRVSEQLTNHFVCQSVALIRPVIAALSKYLELFLCADEGGQSQFAEVVYGAGRPHLSFDQLRALAIPLPPIREQDAVQNAVDLFESEVLSLTKSLNASIARVRSLRQAVLNKAFSGALVFQDPSEEPVSALLKRVTAPRTEEPASSRRRGRQHRA